MRGLPRHGRFFDAVAIAVLLMSAALLPLLAGRGARSVAYRMDAPPTMLPRDNFNELEQFSDRPGSYRWTRGAGKLDVPNPGGALVVNLVLAGGPGRAVLITLGSGSTALRVPVQPQPRSYAVLLPPAFGERPSLTLDAPLVEGERRYLGVVVGDVAVAGGGAAPGIVPVALLAATVGAFALLRRAGLGTLAVGAIVVALQALALLWYTAGGWRYGLWSALLLLAGGAALAAAIADRVLPPRPDAEQPSARLIQRDWIAIGGLVLLALAIRLPWLAAPDPVGDLELSARRMGELLNSGLAGAYTFEGDYMPIRLYVLWGLSQLVLPLGGGFLTPLPAPTMILIKLQGLLSDLVIVGLVYWWSRRWQAGRGAAAIAMLYALSPAVWINVGWWGQVDAFLVLPLVGMIVLFERAGGRWSWACWAIALLIKPQAIIFSPLLFVMTLRRYGARGLALGGSLAVALIAVAATPLLLAGQGPGLTEAYFGSVGRFPRLTNDAYNLWYLLTWGESGADVGQGIAGISFSMIGMALMGVAALLVGLALLRRSDGPARAEAAAVLALAFFCLPTQIHERYLFLTLPFLALCLAHNQRLVVPYMILVVSATLNILGTLHGFTPIAYPYLSGVGLGLLLAVVNLAVLAFLLVHLLWTSWRGIPVMQQRISTRFGPIAASE